MASTTEIESVFAIDAGDSIVAAIVLESTGDDNLTGYEFGVLFDGLSITQGPLTLAGFDADFNEIDTNAVNSPPFVDRSPFFNTTRPVGPEDTVFGRIGEQSFDTPSDSSTSPGAFASFEAGTTGRGLGGETFRSTVFTFTLTGTDLAIPIADNVAINFGDGDGFVFDSTFAAPSDARVSTIGARLIVNPVNVPEPTCIALLAVVTTGLAIRRKRKSL